MRISFEHEDTRVGFLGLQKCTNLILTVEFTEEEKAIIAERKLGSVASGITSTEVPHILGGPTIHQLVQYGRFAIRTASPMHAKNYEKLAEVKLRELKLALQQSAELGPKRELDL